MFEVILQIVSATVLAALAIRVTAATGPRSQQGWVEIVSHFRGGHGQLAKLANAIREVSGNRAQTSEIWAAINGIGGLLRIYANIGVLIETIDFVGGCCAGEPRVAERLKQVRVEVRKAQARVAFIPVGMHVAPLRLSIVINGLASYVTAVQMVSEVIEEFFPNLIRTYRYFITRDYLKLAADTEVER